MHATATKTIAAPRAEAIAKPEATGSRLLSVQALRAIGALLVVWVHSIDAAQLHVDPRQAKFFHLGNFGACGVDIFFAISGFIVSLVAARAARQGLQRRGRFLAARRFFTRRFTRIFPLYWLLTGVVILKQALGPHGIQWYSIQWLPTIFLFPSLYRPENVPLLSLGWSLMFEMYFYAVLAVFMIWTPRSVVRNSAFLLSGMAFAGIWIGIHRPLLVLWMNPLVLEFVFGCLIGLVYARVARGWVGNRTGISRDGRSFAVLGAVMMMGTIFTGYGQGSELQWIMSGYDAWLRVAVWGVPAALLVGGVIFWSPAMRSFPARLLVFLGDASYSIYLCTIPARVVVEHCWGVFGRFGGDVGVFLGALFCTCVGVVCYLFVERPMMRAFHNSYKPISFRSAQVAG